MKRVWYEKMVWEDVIYVLCVIIKEGRDMNEYEFSLSSSNMHVYKNTDRPIDKSK